MGIEERKKRNSKQNNKQSICHTKKYNNRAKLFLLKFNTNNNSQLTSIHYYAKINSNENGANL